VFDALSHARCYKPAWPLPDVLNYIRDVSGTHLDPVIVEALFANLDAALAVNARYPD
jgi:HD-GYP domain-containing protein (c-di-GMP phosphodiesterase class II)